MGKREMEKMLERVAELKTLPEVTQRILALTEDPSSSARDLNEVLKHDVALSVKLLRVVNSAFYGLPGRVADVDRAIVLLGFQAVRNLAIAATMASLFRKPGEEVDGFSAPDLWRHSVATAVAARRLVDTLGFRSLREEAFLAGITHDLGVLVMFQYATPQFRQAIERATDGAATLVDAERDAFELSHQEVGQALTERWKFPKNMQFVAGYHHRPGSLAQEYRLLPAVVCLADDLATESGYKYLATGREGPEVDLRALVDVVNLTEQDRAAISKDLPQMVSEASGWLDL